MNQAEVAMLLALANGHDQRHGIDDVKVQAWFALFRQEAEGLTYEWAAQWVNAYHARSTEMLMPAHIVTAWREESAQNQITQLSAGVLCPHETPGGARYCAICRHAISNEMA
jgi:hypothetical protein